MKPEATIIIPAYNRSTFVREAVLSAVQQTCHCEVIIVDDGSDPEPFSEIEAILHHPDVKNNVRLVRQDHLGVGAARNRGVQEAACDLIQFLDSDDLLHPRKIEIQKAVLDSDRALSMCYCLDEYFKNKPGDFGILWNVPSSRFHLDRFLWDDPVWHTGSPLWRREALEKIRGWDSDLAIGYDDWEFHIRALSERINYLYVPFVLHHIRDHALPRSFNFGSNIALEKSKRHAARLVWDNLERNGLNTVTRSDALAGLMLFSADTLRGIGLGSEAKEPFELASHYAGGAEMRFLAFVLKTISVSTITYRTFSYPFRRLLRRRLFKNRGFWKSETLAENNKATDSNLDLFKNKVDQGKTGAASVTPKFSVIISTHNGASRLRSTLRSHLNQTLPENLYEVILVDNASTDDTREFVTSMNANQTSKIKYLYEEQLGLHNARHAGARAAIGEILVFTDDDASVDPDWLRCYFESFEKHRGMTAAGGPVKALWEKPPESWLLDLVQDGTFFPALGLMDPYADFRLTPDGFFFGVNMAIKKETLFRFGGFNPEAFGERWLGDGESGLLKKLWLGGMHVGFVPGAKVHHHIPNHRMTVDYLKHWSHNWGATEAYAKYSQKMPSITRLIFDFIALLMFRLPKIIYILMRHGPKNDPLSIHRIMSISYTWEQIRYILRLITSAKFRKFVCHQDWLNNPLTETLIRI